MNNPDSGMKRKRNFPINKSYLYFNLKCLTIFGIWNPYEQGLKYKLYRIYSTYYVSVVMLARIISLCLRVITVDNPSQFLQEFPLCAVETTDTIKAITFLVHRVEVMELTKMFNWERHLVATTEMINYRNEVLTNCLSASKAFTITIMIAVVQFCTLHFYMILCVSDYKVENLPIQSIPFRYFFILTNFWVAFICDYVSFTSLALVAVCHDSFIMAVMINITAQLRLLNHRLEKCHMTSYTIDNDVENGEKSDIIRFECIERVMKGEFITLDPNEELLHCIEFHQKILRMVNLFKRIYNKVLLLQLLDSLLLITIGGLQLLLGQQGSLTDSLVACGFLIPVILQLLAYCWGGNIILVESDKTNSSLYASRWCTEDRKFRTNLKIFLGAVRNPLTITAGGLVDLSAVTLKNILTKAYSGVAVLNNATN